MLTQNIFDYHLIPEEKKTGEVDFKGYWKKHAEIPESIKKSGSLGVIKKKLFGVIFKSSSIGLGFFWNRPILMKGGGDYLKCISPTTLPRSHSGT